RNRAWPACARRRRAAGSPQAGRGAREPWAISARRSSFFLRAPVFLGASVGFLPRRDEIHVAADDAAVMADNGAPAAVAAADRKPPHIRVLALAALHQAGDEA